ncbi:beta-fructofuranosidase [Kwoniella heveanensis BCC8398]|uniref:Beta-fructofuranosidase n=1 Tax=Kwoniella heveanensis BCC8398 TaxID=1296120 RepID=A0A1B9GJF3_9TREE|nr:beta-fructofuranosidase [Kwoniella heveanensis BCC8398]
MTLNTRHLFSYAAGALASLAAINAADSTSTPPETPAGTSIEGDYTGALRPRAHFSPPKGFMNDPNGMFVDNNGTWHLYYQYNPTDIVAGNQHWGHATSPDLYHWTNQPIALAPPNSTAGVFSGSAVLDPNNTSGFFPNTTDGVVAIYTLNTPERQVQELAYSYDNGYTFTTYDEGNPVLDVGSNQFRDPKVIWYEDHWVMVIAYASEYTIGIFTSPDLKDWTHASNVSHVGLLGIQYECPNLAKVPIGNSDSSNVTTSDGEGEYVLTISLNPGAPLGGSITQYFPGSFNGTHFTPRDNAARLSNFGKDDYAGQFFYDHPVSIGWASNWQYTNSVPTGNEGWRSAMTLPRKNYIQDNGIAGYQLVQEIYDLSPILKNRLQINDDAANGTTSAHFTNAVYFDINVTLPDSPTFETVAGINFTFAADGTDEYLKSAYAFAGSVPYSVWIDRGHLDGFEHPYFTDKFLGSQVRAAKRIQGVFDRSLFEVYVDGGAVVGTSVVFPSTPLTKLDIGSSGLPEGAQVSVAIWELEDTWA